MTETDEGSAAERWLKRLEPGERLFTEGEVDRRVFVLIEGRVEIAKASHAIAEIGVADSFIGEVGGLLGKPRWATATVLERSTMLVFDDVEALFELEPSWGLRLARVLAGRLDTMNEKFRRLREVQDEHDSLADTLEIVLKEGEGFE